ncbi:TPA: reverse transcriptase family protein [Burkholderia cenocepacia]|uniref:reverse transcriptase family protein n=1 Tax=Burkholderia cenocepacia TaxID=95486 RepID=UPI00078DFD3B|nr:reverse transcriptase family protein [Burkholderia cenocepacia]AMU11119.1 reverse transcriptase [Burkholderia cenocepacia]MBO1858354.1 RNA-directed DNA polymerase [Burkholderia cenocepacia]MCW3540592.1 reverse transcriptase family protein [Burkholderia cenocepacia]MCW3660733.1 reverse transcriptase family protein [Burkholderia cenocepacia]MDR5641373.1 reverse transcriptase family protein [Burkholderia cenocepacia]
MHSSLRDTTRTIAEAMLAGPPERDGVVARMAAVLGEAQPWTPECAGTALARFGANWADTDTDALAALLAEAPAFVRAWSGERRPVVIRIVRRPLVQRPLPAPLAGCDVPQWPTPGDLAGWLGVSAPELDWLSDHWRVDARSGATPLHHYTYVAVDKRSGGCRLVEIPKGRLREAQRRILHGLLDRIAPHGAVHGFRKGHGIVSFATPHADRDVVVRFDLADFFVSVRAARVHALFATLGYPAEVARILTGLCTNRVPSARLLAPDLRDRFDWIGRQRYRERHLPQGAPTSPALANLCAFRLDLRLAALARSVDATYTRYADDLAFSGGGALARDVARLQVRVAAIALEEGFALQLRKTRVMRRGTRQQLAGVVVNRHPNLSRDAFDRLKAILTNCIRRGPASQNRDAHPDFRAHLAGRVAHATALNAARGVKLRALFDRIVWDAGGAGR